MTEENNYVKVARQEFRAAGWTEEHGKFKDEWQEAICNHVIDLLNVFHGEGHSGSSASYAINMFSKLAKFEPLAPLTGEDWEWHEVGEGVFQNKRFSAVFKQQDRFNGQAYWLDGKIFWEWVLNEEGKPFKSYFTGRDSMTPIEFPWVKPEPEYVFRPTEQFPNEKL